MYTGYFKLSEPPFSLTPDPRYLYMSERHREGLAHLFYGVQQPGGFVQLTGEVGCGKTTLSRCLVRQLPPETDVALILNPRLTALELLAAVCDELGIKYPADTVSVKVLIDALNQHLLESHARHRKTVLIIDEAQNLKGDVLEQVRLLTNLETSQEKLLQIILIGQPELLAVLKRKDLRQIAQRVTARYHLLPLSKPETTAYIHHRLLVAGRRDPLFTKAAIWSVYRLSGGVPRLVNILCDRALLGAYALDKQRVTAAIVRRASSETRGVVPWYRNYRLAWIPALMALMVLIAVGATVFKPAKVSNKPKAASAPAHIAAVNPAPKMDAPIDPTPAANSVQETPKIQSKVEAPPSIPAEKLMSLLPSSSSAFADLYARWGTKFASGPGELGCKAAPAAGLECIFQTGGWPKLRRYNLPAILEIPLPTGERKRVALVGLDDKSATLSIAGHEQSVPLSEVARIWDGSFILLWKPPFAPPYQLSPGARGDSVLWVRSALNALEKKAPRPDSNDEFDNDLKQSILRFQRDRSLIQDGFVGNETLVRLAAASGGPDTPALNKGIR
jgi:general secretion pathway protein A